MLQLGRSRQVTVSKKGFVNITFIGRRKGEHVDMFKNETKVQRGKNQEAVDSHEQLIRETSSRVFMFTYSEMTVMRAAKHNNDGTVQFGE